MNKIASKTDCKRVSAYQEGDKIPYEPDDGPYDPNDAGSGSRLAGANGLDPQRQGGSPRQARSTKSADQETVSLRLSPEVVEHFKASGTGWQTRIDNTLVEAVKKRA